MLLPHPESDLSLNLMVLGGDIIDLMHERKEFIFVDEIMDRFLKKDYKRSPDIFFDALTFLYILGLIDYTGHKVKLVKHGYSQQALL